MNEQSAKNLLQGCRKASAAVTAAGSRELHVHTSKGPCSEHNFQLLCEWTVIFFLTNSTHDLAITFSGVPPEQQVAVHWVRTVQTCGKACVPKPSLSRVPGDVWDPRGPWPHPILLQQIQGHCPSSCWVGSSCWELTSLQEVKKCKEFNPTNTSQWQWIPTGAELQGSVTGTPDHRLYFGSCWWRCNKPQSLHEHRGLKMPQKHKGHLKAQKCNITSVQSKIPELNQKHVSFLYYWLTANNFTLWIFPSDQPELSSSSTAAPMSLPLSRDASPGLRFLT